MMLEPVLDLRDSLAALTGAMFGDPAAEPEGGEKRAAGAPADADGEEMPSAA